MEKLVCGYGRVHPEGLNRDPALQDGSNAAAVLPPRFQQQLWELQQTLASHQGTDVFGQAS